MAYQKCPVCNGEGKIINTTSPNGEIICLTCEGAGIIDEITGLPPERGIKLSSRDGFKKVIINDIGE